MNKNVIKLANEMATAMIEVVKKDLNGFLETVDDIEEFSKFVQGLFGLKFANIISENEELRKEVEDDEEASAILTLLKLFSENK